MNSQTIASPFPRLKAGMTINSRLLLKVLTSKYHMRQILKAGPIAQPQVHAVFQRDQALLGRLAGKFEDDSYVHAFADPHDERSFTETVKKILNGKIGLPAIYKPNGQACSDGIIFIEKDPSDHLLLTANLNARHNNTPKRKRNERLIGYINNYSFFPVSKNDNCLQVQIDSTSKDEILDFLCCIWEAVSFSRQMVAGRELTNYDSGMLEAKIQALLYKKAAYETRHFMSGHLLRGKPVFHKDGDQAFDDCWRARTGGSAYFSTTALPWNKMFDPLYDICEITAKSAQEEFLNGLDRILQEEFSYFCARLQAGGLHLDSRIAGQFDLMWTKPRPGSAFPEPVIVEAEFHPTEQGFLKQRIIIR